MTDPEKPDGISGWVACDRSGEPAVHTFRKDREWCDMFLENLNKNLEYASPWRVNRCKLVFLDEEGEE